MSEHPRRRRWWRRLTAAILWYLVPCLVGCAGLAYIYGALVWHVNPPVVAVEGTSMLPTLRTGEIVFLSPVAHPATLKKGDIIAVRVPAQYRTTYSLPANVVHRIVRVEHTKAGLLFITKGDNNPGNDVFTTPAANVVGQLRFVVPGVGFVFLFIQSTEGEIFFGSVALIGLLYYLYGFYEARRSVSQATMQTTVETLQSVLAEAQKFEQRAAANDAASEGPLPSSQAVHTDASVDREPLLAPGPQLSPSSEATSTLSTTQVPLSESNDALSEHARLGLTYVPAYVEAKRTEKFDDLGKVKKKVDDLGKVKKNGKKGKKGKKK